MSDIAPHEFVGTSDVCSHPSCVNRARPRNHVLHNELENASIRHDDRPVSYHPYMGDGTEPCTQCGCPCDYEVHQDGFAHQVNALGGELTLFLFYRSLALLDAPLKSATVVWHPKQADWMRCVIASLPGIEVLREIQEILNLEVDPLKMVQETVADSMMPVTEVHFVHRGRVVRLFNLGTIGF